MGTTADRARVRTLAGLLVGLALGTLGVLGLVRPGQAPALPTPPAPASTAAADPAVVVPEPPESEAAPPARVPAPTGIAIPAIGVDERLEGRALRSDGSFDTPDFGDASWYRLGPRPGEAGGAVVVAHVHGPDGPDVFWDLATLRPGDEVRVRRPHAVSVFVVDAVEQVSKEALPVDRIWPDTEAPLLRLITCGGTRTAAGYPDNTVVYAHLTRTLSQPAAASRSRPSARP